MARRVKPGHKEIKAFLQSAIVDPNNRELPTITRQIIEISDPSYYEMRLMETVAAAKQVRLAKLSHQAEKLDPSALQDYEAYMRQAALLLALAVGNLNETYRVAPEKGAGSQDPGGNSSVS